VKLGATNKWFYKIAMEDTVWRFACLRDLQVPETFPVSSTWIKIYASAFGKFHMTYDTFFYNGKLKKTIWKTADGSHSYLFRHKEKHIG